MQKRTTIEVTTKRGKRRIVKVEVSFKLAPGVTKRLADKYHLKVKLS